ncbi:MAG: host attachment protein [Pseudorhodobacter sp.]|nr:host attachment protein [Pseudorhodobacter sp.]
MNRDSIWGLVLSATRARILRGLLQEKLPRDSELVIRAQNLGLRELMREMPGPLDALAKAEGASQMRRRRDVLREDATTFVRNVVTLLDAHRRAGDFDHLVIFSSPEMLEILRAELPMALKHKVAAEVARNLMHEPEARLIKIVTDTVFGP